MEKASGRKRCGLKASGFPACCPADKNISTNKMQFIHVDDMARVLGSHSAARAGAAAVDGAERGGTAASRSLSRNALRWRRRS